MERAPRPWWHPERHRDRRGFLAARGRIRAGVRRYFEAEGFEEVECGALAVSPGNEAHLHAMATEVLGPDGTRTRRYLHTSPEFACKKLIAAGERRLYTLAQAYRNGERGPLHAPAFSMLEWYRTDESYGAVMDDCLALLACAAEAAGTDRLTYRGRSANPNAPPERLTVAEAFATHAGIDLLATLGDPAALAAAAKVRMAADDSWSDVFSRVLATRIEPKLGAGRPTLLYEYPIVEAALARPTSHDARLAERFELYVLGVELANGFGELTDPAEQRRRFEAEMDEKERVHGERYPLDEQFLEALAIMPAASGVALGFDRLVMLATGAPHIDQVIWTPFEDSP